MFVDFAILFDMLAFSVMYPMAEFYFYEARSGIDNFLAIWNLLQKTSSLFYNKLTIP